MNMVSYVSIKIPIVNHTTANLMALRSTEKTNKQTTVSVNRMSSRLALNLPSLTANNVVEKKLELE